MTVQWKGPGARYRIAALCVPCGGCNVEVGQECKPGWHHGGTSGDRIAMAEALGFVTVPQPGPLFDEKPRRPTDMHARDNWNYADEIASRRSRDPEWGA
jgi:hypothetical protein